MERTPFKFVPREAQNDYVSFERRQGCWSRVGRQGGKQVISLGTGCGLGAAIHEIGDQPPDGEAGGQARRLNAGGLNHARVLSIAADHEIGERF